MSRIHLGVWAFAVVALVGPQEGFSQENEGGTAETQREHIKNAVKAVKSEDFSRAADHYMEAYDISPNPMLLYNAAYAYGRAGRLKLALDASNRVAREGLDDASYAARNKARLHGWRAAIDAKDRVAAMKRLASTTGSRSATVDGPGATPRQWSRLHWIGGGSFGIGAGLLAGALLLDRQIADESETLRDAKRRRDREAYEDSLQKIRRDQKRGRILMVAGGALVAGGVSLFTLELLKNDSETEMSLAPKFDGSNRFGLTIQGAF